MAIIKFKDSVVVPKSCIILAAFNNAVCDDPNIGRLEQITVTSGNDSKHMKGSRHYDDRALDFRSKTFDDTTKWEIVHRMRKRLGPEYDVLLEAEGTINEHIHAEHQGPVVKSDDGTRIA